MYAELIEAVYKRHCDVRHWDCVAESDTINIFRNKTTHKIVVAIRGIRPNNKEDLLACASLINNTLTSTERFRKDKAFILSHQLPYSLVIGHSLGGAILDELLGQGIFSHGISYNPAVEPKYLNNHNNQRYYNPDDFLYMLIGRYASNVHLTKPFSPPLEPGLNLPYIFRLWTAHRIQQFVKKDIAYNKEMLDTSHLVQTVVLNKDVFHSLAEAKAWIQRHGYKHHSADETPNTYRFRQMDPAIIKTGHYRPKMVKMGEAGYMLVLYR